MIVSSRVGSPGLERLTSQTRALVRKKAGLTRLGAPASESTLKSTSEVLVACFTRIWNLGFHLESPRSIKPEHVDALVDSWVSAGYRYATMKNALSRLRQLGLWIDRPNLVSVRAQAIVQATRSNTHPTV